MSEINIRNNGRYVVVKAFNPSSRRLISRGFPFLACMVLLSPVTGLGETQAPAQAVSAAREKTRSQRIMERLRDANGNDVLVSAHRGDWRHYPENSLEAIESAIRIGVDIVEMDSRMTRDGHLVLMHDKSVNRTTTGQGAVSALSLDEIKKLRLKDAEGKVTPYTVPTLEEAMRVVKGRALICLDKSHGHYKQAYEVLKRTGTLDQVTITIPIGLMQFRSTIGPELDDVVAMPTLYLDRADVEQHIAKASDERKPAILQFDFPNESFPVLKQIRELRKNGSRVWANAMWPKQNAGHDDEKALKDPDANYGWLINLGFNIIQTDQPEFLLRYLKGKGLHE